MVHNVLKDFREKYNLHIIKRRNFDNLSESKKRILNRLKDFGIPIDEKTISKSMIQEIDIKLKKIFFFWY